MKVISTFRPMGQGTIYTEASLFLIMETIMVLNNNDNKIYIIYE